MWLIAHFNSVPKSAQNNIQNYGSELCLEHNIMNKRKGNCISKSLMNNIKF